MDTQKLIDPASPAASPTDGPRSAKIAPPPPADAALVTLDHPLRRGDLEIAEIALRKPTVGALRGTKLAELMQMDTDAIVKVLPRLCDLTDAEVKRLDPADLTQLGTEVAGFLLAKRYRDG